MILLPVLTLLLVPLFHIMQGTARFERHVLSTTPHVDLQSAHTLADLVKELTAAGFRMQIVETRASVRDRLRAEGVDVLVGGVNRHSSVAEAVDGFSPDAPGAPSDSAMA